mmetsp:Transcript_39819/g.89216  ORF Transcript_39819/g.89216 Transcript_39819/m.89216 type:complete len:227 (-) Transcript_39819:797-1477(-)
MPALNGDGKGFPAGVTTVAALPLRWRSLRDLGRGEVAVDEHGELLVVEDAQQPLRHHLVQAATQRGQLLRVSPQEALLELPPRVLLPVQNRHQRPHGRPLIRRPLGGGAVRFAVRRIGGGRHSKLEARQRVGGEPRHPHQVPEQGLVGVEQVEGVDWPAEQGFAQPRVQVAPDQSATHQRHRERAPQAVAKLELVCIRLEPAGQVERLHVIALLEDAVGGVGELLH